MNFRRNGAHILEVGCGWGIGAIFCAKHFNANVIGLDADDSVFPYLDHHARLNDVAIDTVQMRMGDISLEQLAAFDMVIAADICFWDSLTTEVGELIERCYQAEVGRVVIADPGRPSFRALAEECHEQLPAIYSDWAVPMPHNQWGLILDIHGNEQTLPPVT